MRSMSPTQDPFMHQEMIEILYHTLWETVHVFFEHRELGHDVGESGFLYPFLGDGEAENRRPSGEVATSILMKVHDDAQLRGAGGAGAIRADQQHGARHSRASATGRQADYLRQRRFGHRRQRLGHRLRASTVGLSSRFPRSRCLSNPPTSPPSPTTLAPRSFFCGSLSRRPVPKMLRSRSPPAADRATSSWRSKKRANANLLTVALLGYDGGEIKRAQLADFPVVVQCDYIPRIQEVQASIYHVIRESMEVLDRGRSLNSSAPPAAPTRRKCASGWSGSAASSWSMTSRPIPPPADACATSPADSATSRLVEDGKVVQVGWQGRSCVVDSE